jgi:hypothetical protein
MLVDVQDGLIQSYMFISGGILDFPFTNIYSNRIISEKVYIKKVQLPSPAPNPPAAAPPGTAPARPVAACAHGRFPNCMSEHNQQFHLNYQFN